MFVRKVSSFIKSKKLKGENISIPDSFDIDDSGFAPMPESVKIGKAKKSENDEFMAKDVLVKSDRSGFTYFMDGTERKRLIFNYNFIPVFYGYVSACILERKDKKLFSSGIEETYENLFLPFISEQGQPDCYFNKDEFMEFAIDPKNIGLKDKDSSEYPIYFNDFARKAHSLIQTTRGNLESSCILKWLELNSKNWLFIDGGLDNKNNQLLKNSKIAGIIKSHNMVYFGSEEQNIIYSLKKGQRTSYFEPENRNVFSWYLRLHEIKGKGNPDFGIIRVEIPAKEELLDKVDEISGWILLETNPIAFPASRWDRMIYPIKYCEDYLKSKAPTWAMIESLS